MAPNMVVPNTDPPARIRTQTVQMDTLSSRNNHAINLKVDHKADHKVVLKVSPGVDLRLDPRWDLQ